jgi:hypothetical protein
MIKQDAQNSPGFTMPPAMDAPREAIAAEPAECPALPLPEGQRWVAGSALTLNDSPAEEFDGIILIVECQPEWSDKPLLKLDCPQMGYMSYRTPPNVRP